MLKYGAAAGASVGVAAPGGPADADERNELNEGSAEATGGRTAPGLRTRMVGRLRSCEP